MSTRIVTATFVGQDGKPAANAVGSVDLVSTGAANEAHNIQNLHLPFRTDGSGNMYPYFDPETGPPTDPPGLELQAPDEDGLAIYYQFNEPDGVSTIVGLEQGGTIDLAALKAMQEVARKPWAGGIFVPKDLTGLTVAPSAGPDDLVYLDQGPGTPRAIRASDLGTGGPTDPDPTIRYPDRRPEMVAAQDPIAPGGTVSFTEGSPYVTGTGTDFTVLSPFDVILDSSGWEHHVLRVESATRLQLLFYDTEVQTETAPFQYRKVTGLVIKPELLDDLGWTQTDATNWLALFNNSLILNKKRSEERRFTFPSLWTHDRIARGWIQVVSRNLSQGGGFAPSFSIEIEKLDGNIDVDTAPKIADLLEMNIGLRGNDTAGGGIRDGGYMYIHTAHTSDPDAPAPYSIYQIAIHADSGEIELRGLTTSPNPTEPDRLWNEGGVVRITPADPQQKQAPSCQWAGIVNYDAGVFTVISQYDLVTQPVAAGSSAGFTLLFPDKPLFLDGHFITLVPSGTYGSAYSAQAVRAAIDPAPPADQGRIEVVLDSNTDPYEFMVQVWETRPGSQPTQVPDAVTDLTATPAPESIQLDWTNPTGQAIFETRVTRDSTTIYQGSPIEDLVDLSRTPGVSHDYQVFNTNLVGESAGSNIATGAAIHPVPAAVSDLAATPGIQVVDLAWTNPTGQGTITSVRVTRDGSGIYNGAPVEAFQDTGLTPETDHDYLVYTSNSTGESQASNLVTAAALHPVPDAPTALVATPTVGAVGLDWTNPTGQGTITGNKVYRDGSPIYDGPALEVWSDTTGTPGVTYAYTVSAINSTGEGSESAPVPAAALHPVPDAVADLAATPGPEEIDLAWTNPTGQGTLTQTRVTRDGNDIYADVPIQALNDPGRTPGVDHDYQVFSSNSTGESAGSNVETAAALYQVPDAVSDLAGTPGDTYVDLTWTNPTGFGTITAVHIYQDDVKVDTIAGNLEAHRVTGLANDQEYKFEVTTENATGESALSNAVLLTPTGAGSVPDAITDLVAVRSSNTQALLTWTNPSGQGVIATSVYRDGVPIADTIGPVETYQDNTLDTNTAYVYEVTSHNSVGESPRSNQQQVWQIPAVPTLAIGSVGNQAITLAITPGDGGESGYMVEYADNAGFVGSTEEDIFSNLTPTISGLTNGQQYWFRARSYNPNRDESDNSNTVTDTPVAPAQEAHPRQATMLYFPDPVASDEYTDATGNQTVAVSGGAPALVAGPWNRGNVWNLSGSQWATVEGPGNPFTVIDTSFLAYILYRKAPGTAGTSMGFFGNGADSGSRAGMNFQMTGQNARIEIEDNSGNVQKNGVNTVKLITNHEEWNSLLFFLDITGGWVGAFANGLCDYRLDQGIRPLTQANKPTLPADIIFPITPFHSQGMAVGNRRPPSASLAFNGDLIVGFDAWPSGGMEEVGELAIWWNNLRRGRSWADMLDNGTQRITSIYGGLRAVTVQTDEAVAARVYSFGSAHDAAPVRSYAAVSPVDGQATVEMPDLPDGLYEARVETQAGAVPGWYSAAVFGNQNTPQSYRATLMGCMDMDGVTTGDAVESQYRVTIWNQQMLANGGQPLLNFIFDDYHYKDPLTKAIAVTDWQAASRLNSRLWWQQHFPGLHAPGNHELGPGDDHDHSSPEMPELMQFYARTSPYMRSGGVSNLVRMPDPTKPYQSMVHGRVRWIMLETYTSRGEVAADRMLSDAQRTQLLADLDDCIAQGQIPILMSTHTWQGDTEMWGQVDETVAGSPTTLTVKNWGITRSNGATLNIEQADGSLVATTLAAQATGGTTSITIAPVAIDVVPGCFLKGHPTNGIKGDTWDAYMADKNWLKEQIKARVDANSWFWVPMVCGDLHFSAKALQDVAGRQPLPTGGQTEIVMFLRGKIVHSFGGSEGGLYTTTPGNATYPSGKILGSPHWTVVDVTDNGTDLTIQMRNMGNNGFLDGLDFSKTVQPVGSPPAGATFSEELNETGEPIGGGNGFSDIRDGTET